MDWTLCRPLTEVIRNLASARILASQTKAMVDALREQWEQDNEMYLDAAGEAARVMHDLEAEIRTRGALIAAETRQAPCPGTKMRNERVVRYTRYDHRTGEIVQMDAAVVRQNLTDWLIAHGATSLLKPDQAATERMAKAMPESEWPTGMTLEYQTVVSIDSDLSPLLETETAPEL